MINRLRTICDELEDMSAIIMQGSIDRSILENLGKLGEGDPEYAMNKADELFFEAASAVITLMDLIEGEEK
jgi:hypothetical protein